MIARVREQKDRHRQRSRVYRIAFAAAAVILVVAGLALSAPGVPGPGLVVVAVGLAMLALEFERAERLLELVLRRVDAVEEAAERSRWAKAGVYAGGALVGIAAVAAALYFFNIPLVPG